MIVAFCASLLSACVVFGSRERLWYDEIVTLMLVSDPSPTHMVRAIAGGADSAPPLYHLLARLWEAIAGHSVLSLRLFSSLGFCAAFAAFFVTLRRAFGRGASILGALIPFCFSPVITEYNAEVRFYGLFMALSALAVLLCHRLMTEEHVGALVLGGNALTNALLVLTHPFGMLYSGLLGGALLAWDLTRGRQRERLVRYASFVAAWSVLLLWLRPLSKQAAVAPRSWIPQPNLFDLTVMAGLRLEILPVAVLVAVLVPAFWPLPPSDDDAPSALALRSRALLLIAASLLAALPITFVASHLATSVFRDRYFMPVTMAWGIVLAYVATASLRAYPLPNDARPSRVRDLAAAAVWSAIVVPLLLKPAVDARWSTTREDRLGTFQKMLAPDPQLAGLPVVVEDMQTFLEFRYYTPGRRPYWYIRDSVIANAPESAPAEAIYFNMGGLYQRAGYLGPLGSTDGADGPRFLCTTPRFVVIDDPMSLWFERRVAADSVWSRRLIGLLSAPARRDSVWLVERRADVPGPSHCPPGRP